MTSSSLSDAGRPRPPVRDLPRVELHVHLEGAVPLPALLTLIDKYGDPGVSSLGDLEERFHYKDFPQFIRTWIWMTGFLREYEDYEFIADAVAVDLAFQGLRYAELTYAPGPGGKFGLTVAGISQAVRRGLDRHRDLLRTSLIGDLIRDNGPEQGERWLREMAEVRVSAGIAGIGIGGSEQRYPPEPYADVFELARKMGFRTCAHAGEAAGPESVWGALRALKVDRIGHGTRAAEDPALVEHLRIHRVPLECCPVSNVRTGVVADLRQHPLRHFIDKNLIATVNTDDPKMFGTSLNGEFSDLVDQIGLTPGEIRRLARNAIDAAWCDEELKRELGKDLQT